MQEQRDREFIAEHEPMVRRLAGRIRAQLDLSTDFEDLVQYGYGGLLEARDRFDPTRGVQFTTFAHYRIRGAILDGVRAMAYLPRKIHAQRKAAEAMDRAAEAVAVARGASPDTRADLGATLQAIDDIIGKTSAAYVISVVGQGDQDLPPDPEAGAVILEERSRIARVLELLPDRERALLEGHYFHDRTLEEIGKEMGISKSWASRLHSRALALLRSALGTR